MLGIENIKNAVKFVIDFHLQISETKKFRLTSIFNFVDELLQLGTVITNWKVIIEEFKDFTPAERQEVYEYAKQQFDIPDDEVEVWVEDVLNWLLYTISLVERAKALRK
jgi:hypothetical protein